MALSGFFYNMFYYKNKISSYFFPDYAASSLFQIFCTPRKIPERQIETDILKTLKYSIIEIPTENYIKNVDTFLKKPLAQADLPEKISLYEFVPEGGVTKNFTVLCCHGWEGRGSNFVKFIQPLLDNGFRILCVDFPQHGNTGGPDSGVSINSHTINCIVNYFDYKFAILAHSLGNTATCVTFYSANEKILNKIIGFCAIGIGDSFKDFLVNFFKQMGLMEYSYESFYQKCTEKLGFDCKSFGNSQGIQNMNIPVYIIHDENDKELPFTQAISNSKACQRQNLVIDGKKVNCLHLSKGLGHRRIIRDDGIIKLVVDFFTKCQDFENI